MSGHPELEGLHFFTIGHSSHTAEHFLALLRRHAIEVIVDTRSSPYSRHAPHFDREALKSTVTAASIRYLWMGDLVGGRPRDPGCYDPDGRVLYSRVAALDSFREGIDRLARGAREFRVALLCSEEDPAHCHRRLLIARVLAESAATISHIRGDGTLESDTQVAARTGKPLVNAQPALFGDIEEQRWRSTSIIGKAAARTPFE